MLPNRSIPPSTVIPELAYTNVTAAAEWLCDAFGFTLRVSIGDHRAQLNVGDGSIVVVERPQGIPVSVKPIDSVMVRVADVDAHHQRAVARRVQIIRPPTTYPFGERQYTAVDPAGHQWTFSQSVADVAPEEWGGVSGDMRTSR
jgi:uncharacterized glyoxalase superfamily protein PhnB